METKTKNPIPKISDNHLKEMMDRIRFVNHAMKGTDGKIHHTMEKDPRFFELFYQFSNANPRKEAFNFDKDAVWQEKAEGLKILSKLDIYVKVGGYYGFCKVTMAEVMAQIPQDIAEKVVAFSLDPENDAEVIMRGEYQSLPIILYEKSEELEKEILPVFEGLIKPVSLEKAEKFKDKIRPAIYWHEKGLAFIDPGDLTKPYLTIGIWLRINGSNLHKINSDFPAEGEFVEKESIEIYQEFGEGGADIFQPTYAHIISQIPENLLTEEVVGFRLGPPNYFKTDKGVIHSIKCYILKKD
ncbi:MAG: hypothetical protein KC516_02015 [Nanoarchaeota archaeon]|nr:hypothetical protein [Nanoarchaeota archaeon]